MISQVRKMLHEETIPFLPPATKLRQGNVLTPVCHSVHGGGVSATPPCRHPPAQCMLGYTPPPSACWDTVNKRAVRIPLECILVPMDDYSPMVLESSLQLRVLGPCSLFFCLINGPCLSMLQYDLPMLLELLV